MEFIKKNKLLLILVPIGIIFFFIYSYLPISQLGWLKQNNSDLSLRFNTPDEVINHYFTNQYVETGELYYFEPLDNFMHRVVFPRWAYVVDGKITPVSPGSYAFVPNNALHQFRNTGTAMFKFICIVPKEGHIV